jgi:hypothetical protein
MIGPYYVYWHYTRGIAELTRNLLNFLIFEFHFFSVKELLLTLFQPFQRLKEGYGTSIVDFENIATALVVNTLMRLVGFFVRTVILIFAAVTILISAILLPIILLIWLVLPFLLFVFMSGAIWAYLKYKP